MAQDFGNGVSRTLSAAGRQFEVVVWQADKPPLDSELNLMAQVDMERVANAVRASMHSGFLADPLVADTDFVVDPAHSNRFFLGRQAAGEEAPILWANVNGWLVPVTGTLVPDGDTSNQVNLFPPPSSDTRIDLVFLEVWLAQVAPNPSTLNKPSATTLYKYGNTLFGGTNLPDDLEDPTVGFETTERVQVQYRLRVYGSGSGLGASVDLSRYPDGLGDPNVLGRGASAAPVGGFSFMNMREELGDPSLWRAGDGDATNALGTVDGYTYAVPVCAVFRRNTQPFTAISTTGNEQQNGSINRNPLSVPVVNPADGATTFGPLTLTSALSASGVGAVSVTGLAASGFGNPNINWSSTFIVIDGEIIGVDSVSVAGNTITINASGRGRWGTQAAPHDAGATVQFFNWRMDGLFADQVAAFDILDLRRTVTPGEWDYHQLLVSNFSRLLRNQLRTSYKQSGVTGGDVEGVVIPEIDSLYSAGAAPDQTDALDGFDGIRTVFSDAAVAQSDVTVLLDAPAGAGVVANYTSGSAWEVAAGFVPDGFGTAAGWTNGSIINLYIGGANGNSGARRTVLSASNRIVRFLSPKEMWLTRSYEPLKGRQTPVTLRFLGSDTAPSAGQGTEPAAGTEPLADHPGPVFPLPEYNFERPFIVLGGVVNDTLLVAGTAEAYNSTTTASGLPEVKLTGVNFNTPGVFFPTAGVTVNDPAACSQPLLHGTRTLYDMLTAGGTDLSGKSSEVYLVLSGDTTDPTITNGVFRVIGAGDTAGYTTNPASAADQVVVEFIREAGGPSDFVNPGPTTGLTAELRSQYTHTLDDNGSVAGPSALTIVLTDINGTSGGNTNPWAGLLPTPIDSLLAVNTTLQYGPSRGGMSRVPDAVLRFATVNPSATDTFVRNHPSEFDATFSTAASVPPNETYFPVQPVQAWNRLSSLGLNAPFAPAYGGLRAAFTEQDREAELFVDGGSKTVMFRPLVKREMTVVKRTLTSGNLIPAVYPNTHAVDPEGFFVSPTTQGIPLPPEYMPRFGRQDIPCHLVDPLAPAAGAFLFGYNHLFADTTDDTDTVFNILVGGSTTTSNPSMFLQTDPASTLDYGDYGAIPGGGSAYQGRLFADVNIVSSEGGQGMKGIQLPPFLGIARVYAVYDARDWNGVSAFAADRVTPNPAGAPNLLRTDVDKQTLYFLQGGAADFTGNDNDHTYIVPENIVDIRRSNSYVAGEAFSDLHYVVEFMAFGFARGFVNKNTYVLARNTVPSTTTGPLLPDLQMVVNAAAKYPTQAYIGYARTVYQGDPYMTRAGSVRSPVDYQTRYGQVPVASAYAANTPIQQYTLTGEQIPETPNARALEVLAAVDFYTTLGTGKVGGRVYAGTPLDIGTLAPTGSRVPASATAPMSQSVPRVFTAGQSPTAPHAHLAVGIVSNATVLLGNTVTLTRGTTSVTFTGGVDFTGANAVLTAESLALAVNTSNAAKNLVRVYAEPMGQAVNLISVDAGAVGNSIRVAITPRAGLAFYGLPVAPLTSQSYLQGGEDIPANGKANPYASTPVELTGLTERLPLGILMQDSDFVGEDPLHDGTSILASRVDAVNLAANFQAPMRGQQEYNRMVGGAGSFIALADGSILEYTPYNAVLTPTGARSFRLFRGGGSAYVIGTGMTPGGPVEFSAGSFPEGQAPVLKGAVLVGKALLVRNYHEEAFAISDTTTEGDELQMVVLTQAVVGEGKPCGYTLSGEISPTGYGEGYAAADRYRLVGKPMHAGHSRTAPPTDIPLAPYPAVDPNEPDPCA